MRMSSFVFSELRKIPIDWKRSNWDSIHVHSHVKKDYDIMNNEGMRLIDDILKLLTYRQNPSKNECVLKRLLVLDLKTTSLEGLGSILKNLIYGISIGMHSNRVLVFGVGLPYLFENTKDIWSTPEASDILIGDTRLNCSTATVETGGPFECFFQRLSTCSISDTNRDELVAFSKNAFDTDARLLALENTQTIRQSLALYHPPEGLFDYLLSSGNYSLDFQEKVYAEEAHFWSSAVCAYIFRIKPELAVLFQERHNGFQDVWGLHIRHGDVKAMRDLISYKKNI